MKLFLTLSVLLFFAISGCNNEGINSEIPEINFESVSVYKNMTGKDSMLVLKINYKDGDGDLGLNLSDTLPPFNFGSPNFNNFMVDYFVKNKNEWEHILIPGSLDTLNFNQRIQRLNLSHRPKAIKGSIDLRIPAIPHPGLKPDTIKLISFMLDRKLHKSNLAESNTIILKH